MLAPMICAAPAQSHSLICQLPLSPVSFVHALKASSYHPESDAQRHVCSVEPTASSHVFLIYGEACVQDRWHPNCTHTDPGTRPLGKLFSLDINQLLGNEWQVRIV